MLEEITALVMDVDGVLTDGGIIYSSSGSDVKEFNVRDGAGLKYWQRAGHKAALLSGRESATVERRAAELGIEVVMQGAKQKIPAFEKILAKLGCTAKEVAYIGDDLPDLPVMRRAGFAVAVADAAPEVGDAADYVTKAPGGRGAVREVIEHILRAQGRWKDIMARYE